jgi:transposase-like protein
MTPIEREFANAPLGDLRRGRRLVQAAAELAVAPEKSFPQAAPTPASLRGMYRLVNNDAVTADAILEPHREQTAQRAREAGEVYVVHDTTQLEFGGEDEREDLGFLRSEHDQGFSLHLALAIASGESPRPLGALDSRTWARRVRKPKRRRGGETTTDETSEGRRWLEQVASTERRLQGVAAIHVADREADAYALLKSLVENGWRFVIRMRQDRAVVDEDDQRAGFSSEHISAAAVIAEISVPLARRASRPMPGATHAGRTERTARLALSSTSLRRSAMSST